MKNNPSNRLLKRLREELKLNIPYSCVIRRTYAGRNQLSAGAWKWFLYDTSGLATDNVYANKIGSYDTVGTLLKAKELELVDDGGNDKSIYIKEK